MQKHYFLFKSSSTNTLYQVLIYEDGSMSCDCKGWTLRCKNGQRTCKHIRLIQMGAAQMDPMFAGSFDCATGQNVNPTTIIKSNNQPTELVGTNARKFNFED